MIVTLCAGCWMAVGAQTTFTERLQKNNDGEGQVTVTQSKEIDDLINGTGTAQPTQQPTNKSDENTATNQEKPHTRPGTTATQDSTTVIDSESRRKVMKGGYKVNGWRVQVFAGGNSRNDRLKAEQIGREMNQLFPGEPVYTHFYSPRWICRMGNYRTYEEAHEVLLQVKKLGYQSAIIVKGKITVSYPPQTNP
ncbi:MAG: SPOR domain-containing protein [Prevotella sp.]|nr:SPOR domain-containing protein [Prevotella sp.]